MALSTARTLPALRDEYASLYATMAIVPSRLASVDAVARRIAANEDRYRGVADPAGVPWYLLGIVQSLEGGGFAGHLHNGDSLNARTINTPAGRPTAGSPPFTWEESARDAIASRGWSAATDWSVPGILFELERYNGFGYRPYGIATPYLWSFTNHYSRGKFVSDGARHFDPNAVSAQAGGAAVLRRLSDLGVIDAQPAGTNPYGSTSLWKWVLAGLGFGAAVYYVATDD